MQLLHGLFAIAKLVIVSSVDATTSSCAQYSTSYVYMSVLSLLLADMLSYTAVTLTVYIQCHCVTLTELNEAERLIKSSSDIDSSKSRQFASLSSSFALGA